MPSRVLPALLLAILLSTAAPALAAEDGAICVPTVPGRPSVGLVLSGGGARGAAHVGVLRVLEQLRIPIDCIAGTSSGAIVGGLYAAGLDPDAVQRVYVEVDWNRAFSDRPSRRTRSFRRKLDDATFLGNLELGIVDGGFRLPSGVIAGQHINTLLKTATLHSSSAESFDHLAIPFRAIATDMNTGRMVVLGRGDLARAMRASMSVPAIFAPVEIDGRLLADGGLVRNLPVDVARVMGAEVIIAVDVGTPLAGKQELADLVGLSVQVINVLTQQNVDQSLEQLRADDVLIKPPLGELGATDFERGPEAVDIGRDAAHAALAPLAQLAVTEEQWAAFLARQRHREETLPTIDFVRVTGNVRVATELIESRIKTEPGQPLKLERVYRDVERVYAIDDFEQVFFDLVEDGERTGLEVRVREKSWGPNYLKFGVKIADDLEGSTRFSLLVNHLRTNVNRRGGEWRNELRVGMPRGIATEFYQPLDTYDDWFLALGAGHDSRENDYFVGDVQFATYRRALTEFGIDFGRQVSTFGEVRVGYRGGRVRNEKLIGVPVLNLLPEEEVGMVRFRATVDQLDDPYFPTSGFYSRLAADLSRVSLGATADYDKFSFVAGGAFSWERNTWVLEGSYGDDRGTGLPLWDQFTLGGFLDLAGYRQQQLRGDRFVAARAVYYNRVPGLPEALADDLYLGMSVEGGNTWFGAQPIDLDDLRYGGSLFIGMRTFVGPVHLAVGMAEDSRITYYFSLGRTF
jgi:NTE family protein